MKQWYRFWNKQETKMKKADYIILGILLLIYGILSFINLGSTTNPQTFYTFYEQESVVFEFPDLVDIVRMKFYNGEINGTFSLSVSSDNKEYTFIKDITGNGAFSWNEEKILERAKYLKIESQIEGATLGSIVFYDNTKEEIKVSKATSSVSQKTKKTKVLLDEKTATPEEISYLNSSYFDEIYFARTAYEYTYGLEAYEWVHPPLGKLIQAIPIKLSNTMAPFYYRFMGNVAGILMIAVMYLFGKIIFQKRKYAILAALLMMFDCFHFAQTRMGTVDSFLVLFIMLSYYFMIRYMKEPNKQYHLLFSGLFFGMATSVKWTGLFAGLGLAIIFLVYVFKKKQVTTKLVGKCCLFFIAIPLVIYIGSYLLFPNVQVTYTDSLSDILVQTEKIYEYHSELEDDHPFSSPWYSWPICYKPVWYYTNNIDEYHHGTITGIGNIAIWWTGVLAFLYLIIRWIRKKDPISFMLLVAGLTLWLPYIFIGRVMFLYHYFPVLPFIMLSIVTLFYNLVEKTKKEWIIPLYSLIIIVIFCIYYPAISGNITSNNYLEQLKLFSTWYF